MLVSPISILPLSQRSSKATSRASFRLALSGGTMRCRSPGASSAKRWESQSEFLTATVGRFFGYRRLWPKCRHQLADNASPDLKPQLGSCAKRRKVGENLQASQTGRRPGWNWRLRGERRSRDLTSLGDQIPCQQGNQQGISAFVAHISSLTLHFMQYYPWLERAIPVRGGREYFLRSREISLTSPDHTAEQQGNGRHHRRHAAAARR
jgi:hypothetical protein